MSLQEFQHNHFLLVCHITYNKMAYKKITISENYNLPHKLPSQCQHKELFQSDWAAFLCKVLVVLQT